MTFVLYNAPQSTCSQKVRITLWEKGLEFTEEKLDLFKGDQLTPEYKAINVNGVVPTLVAEGRPIIDSSVIMEYLEECFPTPALTPSDSYRRADMRAFMRFFEEVPVPAIRIPSYNLVFLRHFRKMTEEEFAAFGESKPLRKDFFLRMGRKGYSEEEMKQARGGLRLTVERMEKALSDGREWLIGEYSLADISVLPVFVRMDDIGLGELWADCRRVTDWYRRFREKNAVKRAFYHGSLLTEQYGAIG